MSASSRPDNDSTADQLGKLRAALRYFERTLKDTDDKAELAAWLQQVEAIELASTRTLNCSVALLGESGAGKSSLLNALIGVDLLPHDSGSAVTAAVTEIEYQGQGFGIVAEVEDLATFKLRFERICQNLRDAAAEAATDSVETVASFDNSDVSIAKAVTGLDPLDLLKESTTGSEWTLVLPEVQHALENGPNISAQFADSEIDDLKETCRDLLSSRGSLWPIVRRVVVGGPFVLLQSGIRLVDVPGLNDPDAERNRIALESLQKAQLVWLVLNSKRAMTNTIMQYLTSSKLLTKLEMSGRLGSLVVVATHADQFDEQGLIRACGLSNDVSIGELLEHHERRVGAEVRRSLLRAWDESVLNADGHVSPQTNHSGRATLEAVPFFSVSSTESLLLRNIVKSKRLPNFESDEQSGIPRLTQWMVTEFVQREQNVHKRELVRRTSELAQVIRSTLTNRESGKRLLAGLQSAGKGGLKGSTERAQTFLAERLQEHRIQAAQAIERQSEAVKLAIEAGINAASVSIIRDIPSQLGSIHWATLRAIVRRNGQFNGSTKYWDIPKDIADIITGKVVFRWAELFEASATGFLDAVVHKCGDLLSQHAHMLHELISQGAGTVLSQLNRLAQPTQGLKYSTDLKGVDIGEQLLATRMSFEHDLLQQLRVEMQPIFEAAAAESGRGMKARIVSTITGELARVAPSVLPALSHYLHEKVVEVDGILMWHVERSHEEVSRLAGIEAKNLETALTQRTPEELLHSANTLAEGLSMFAASPIDSAAPTSQFLIVDTPRPAGSSSPAMSPVYLPAPHS